MLVCMYTNVVDKPVEDSLSLNCVLKCRHLYLYIGVYVAKKAMLIRMVLWYIHTTTKQQQHTIIYYHVFLKAFARSVCACVVAYSHFSSIGHHIIIHEKKHRSVFFRRRVGRPAVRRKFGMFFWWRRGRARLCLRYVHTKYIY